MNNIPKNISQQEKQYRLATGVFMMALSMHLGNLPLALVGIFLTYTGLSSKCLVYHVFKPKK